MSINIDFLKELQNRPVDSGKVKYEDLFTKSAYIRLQLDCESLRTFTILDVKEQFKDYFLNYLQVEKTDALFVELQNMAYFCQLGNRNSLEKEDFLASKRHELFFQDIKRQAGGIIKKAVNDFQNGANFSILMSPNIDAIKFNVSLIEKSQANSIQHSTLSKMQLLAALLEPAPLPQEMKQVALKEQKWRMRTEMHFRQYDKSRDEKKREHDKILKDCHELPCFFLFLSSKLGRDLDKIILADLEAQENQKAFLEFQEKKKIRIEIQQALEVEKSFLTSPVKTTSIQKGKKKKNRNHSVTSKQEKIDQDKLEANPIVKSSPPLPISIFPQKSDYFLDKRVTRWFHTTHEGIRKFTDKVLLKTVCHYQKLSPEELEEQHIHHNLPGIDRLMSLSAENFRKYSTPYQFMHNGTMKNGRCFHVELRHGKDVDRGLIYVGADGKRIYHAKFASFGRKSTSDDDFNPKDLCVALDGLDSFPETSEGEWEKEGGYSFEVRDEAIIWDIGTGKTAIQYIIQPLF